MSVIEIRKLEQLLQAHWTEFIDHTQIMKNVLEYVQQNEFKILNVNSVVKKLSVTVSNILFCNDKDKMFEIWVEITAPKQQGVVIGTVIFISDGDGNIEFKSGYASLLLPANPSVL